MEYGDAAASAPIRKLVTTGRAPRPDRAVRALADWAGEGAAVELSSLLGADPQLNESVFSRLRDVRRRHPDAGRRELESALARLFSSPDRRVRRGAAQAASELAVPVDALVALVQDREPSVRCAAMAATRLLALPTAADAIETRLDDDDPDVRVAAVTALAALKPAARPMLDRAVADEDCAWAKRKMESSLAPTTTQIK
jgi:hypothetical protein